ncbi:MAG: hypothetical protein M2R46_05643 [Verrucomicrobia subdivision 3 bacterium]|nr:hypothetical protein [Limisphaerales bacterium]
MAALPVETPHGRKQRHFTPRKRPPARLRGSPVTAIFGICWTARMLTPWRWQRRITGMQSRAFSRQRPAKISIAKSRWPLRLPRGGRCATQSRDTSGCSRREASNARTNASATVASSCGTVGLASCLKWNAACPAAGPILAGMAIVRLRNRCRRVLTMISG